MNKIVMCEESGTGITKKKLYEVVEETMFTYRLIDDFGKERNYNKNLFVEIEPPEEAQEQKVESSLNIIVEAKLELKKEAINGEAAIILCVKKEHQNEQEGFVVQELITGNFNVISSIALIKSLERMKDYLAIKVLENGGKELLEEEGVKDGTPR